MQNDEFAQIDAEESPQSNNEDTYWLELARTMYSASTDFLDSSVRKRVEKNVAHFNNRHAKDSKFNSPNYRNRNRMFHPKTRNGERSNEAAFAAAMFSTADLVSIGASDPSNPAVQASAEIHQQLLNHRLEITIPWFLTAMGAYQEAQVFGLCASYNHWKYRERTYKEDVQALHPLTGEPLFIDGEPAMIEVDQVEVIEDEPCIDLIPFENLRFDPAADWRDPINKSPYVIREVPMYAGDVLAQMSSEDSKTGAQPWREYTLAQLLSSEDEKREDSTQRAREGEERQSSSETQAGGEFTTVWLREYFVRKDGEEYVYWTVGNSLILADPVPLEEVYLHGERPITLGICVLEAHKTYPTSPVELNSQLQERVNSVVNQRADNVDLVLNKRYYIKRGAKIDTPALMRNTPGGGVVMDDIHADIRTESTPDVTSSSYAEQDRLDVIMDESAGAFSQSSVQNNRALNETVGGMEMMNAGASAISEYTIRTFVETWVEPTLRQLVKLEAAYETDETLLALAAGKTDLFQRYGQNLQLDALLDAELTVRVNVGMGATNPQQKLERMRTGFMTVGQIAPQAIPRIKEEEVVKEVFGALGYKDGARFFDDAEEQSTEPPQDPMLAVRMKELELKQSDQEFGQQLAAQKLQDERERWMAELALKERMTVAQLEQKTGLERDKIHTQRQIAAGKLTEGQTKLQLQAENLAQQHDTF